MPIQLGKDSIDLGIVVRDADAALRFYRDTLGMTAVGDGPMPGGVHMHRLMCGTTMVKLLVASPTPEAAAAGGGITGASGYRYFTINVTNIQELFDECVAAGYQGMLKPRALGPITIAMVADPDGNVVEFLQS